MHVSQSPSLDPVALLTFSTFDQASYRIIMPRQEIEGGVLDSRRTMPMPHGGASRLSFNALRSSHSFSQQVPLSFGGKVGRFRRNALFMALPSSSVCSQPDAGTQNPVVKCGGNRSCFGFATFLLLTRLYPGHHFFSLHQMTNSLEQLQ